jgi:GntR family transcriptional repressor for pyruvate dehydrogenase complex
MAIQVNKLEPVKRINLTSQVMDSVKAYIAENNLRSGDRLPTERELTLTLGVSRNILREALKSLQALGLIEIKVGDGMYVSDFDYSSVVTHISFALSRSGQDLKHFIEARLITEVGALDLVVKRICDEDMAFLEELNSRIESASSVEAAAEIDLDFHRALLSTAGNPVISEFGNFLGQFFMEARHLVGVEAKFRTAKGHRDLLDALRDRDAVRAKEIMRRHIQTWEDR